MQSTECATGVPPANRTDNLSSVANEQYGLPETEHARAYEDESSDHLHHSHHDTLSRHCSA